MFLFILTERRLPPGWSNASPVHFTTYAASRDLPFEQAEDGGSRWPRHQIGDEMRWKVCVLVFHISTCSSLFFAPLLTTCE